MDTHRGKYRNAVAGALDSAMTAANIDAALLARVLSARRNGPSCTPQYIRQLRSGQRVRVRPELARAIEAVLLRWSPDAAALFTDPTDDAAEQVCA